MSEPSSEAAVIREALERGLQVWRTTVCRDEFLEAFAALATLEARLTEATELAEQRAIYAHEQASRMGELSARLDEAEARLAAADRLVSIVHDAIWSKEVASTGILHDNDREDSAQATIWKLHELLRATLPPESEER